MTKFKLMMKQKRKCILSVMLLVAMIFAGASFHVSAQEAPIVSEIYDFTKMSEAELKDDFSIIREDAENWSLEAGKGLVLKNQQGGLYGGGGSCKNIFLLNTAGDFTVTTKIVLSEQFTANWQQFDLLIYQDDDNYIKLNYGMNGGTGCQFLFEKNGSEVKSFGMGLSTTMVWLKIEKVGNTYAAYVSTDGANFNQLGESYEMELTAPKIGLAAHNDGGEAPVVDVAVEYVDIITDSTEPPVTPEPPVTNEPPLTGDNLMTSLWLGLCAFGMVAMIGRIGIARKKQID